MNSPLAPLTDSHVAALRQLTTLLSGITPAPAPLTQPATPESHEGTPTGPATSESHETPNDAVLRVPIQEAPSLRVVSQSDGSDSESESDDELNAESQPVPDTRPLVAPVLRVGPSATTFPRRVQFQDKDSCTTSPSITQPPTTNRSALLTYTTPRQTLPGTTSTAYRTLIMKKQLFFFLHWIVVRVC